MNFNELENECIEYIGNISIGDHNQSTPHWVNIVEAKVGTKINCLGHSKVVVRQTKIWDPIDGKIKTEGWPSFNYIGIVKY